MPQTRSGKVINTQIQFAQEGHDASSKTAKAGQRSINRSILRKGHTEGSNSANGSAIAEDAVEEGAANLASSASVDSASANPIVNVMPTSQDAAVAIAQPTNPSATIDAVSMSRMAGEAIGVMSTITNAQRDSDVIGTASSQGSSSRPIATAQNIGRARHAVRSTSVKSSRKRTRRRVIKRGFKPIIVTPNSSHDPITVDDDTGESEADTSGRSTPNRSLGAGDHQIPHSIKQVLQHRQRHIEQMKGHVDGMLAHTFSTADSDQSGNFDGTEVGEKRSFEEFLLDEIDDMDQPRKFANDFLTEVRKYQGLLRRTKNFHKQ